jgi:hypothetical protein
MKTKQLVTLAALAVVASACSDEDLVRQGEQTLTANDYIEATMNLGDTRTYLAENKADIYWSEEDQILVYTEQETSGNSYIPYTLTSGFNSSSAVFSGDYNEAKNGTKCLALYPYSSYLSKEPFTYDAEHKYISLISLATTISCTDETSLQKFPMVAMFGENNSLAFQNPGALLDLTIKNVPAGYDAATLTSMEAGISAPYLSGPAQIGFRHDIIDASMDFSQTTPVDGYTLFPFLKVVDCSSDYISPSLVDTLTWTASPTSQDIHVLIPLPLADMFNLMLEIGKAGSFNAEDADYMLIQKMLSSITPERNTRYIRVVDCMNDEERTVADAAAATRALAGTDGKPATTSVTIEEISGTENTITLPANQDGSQDITIRINKVASDEATGVKLSIVEETASGDNRTAKNVKIVAEGSGLNAGFCPLTVNAPNSVVSLEILGFSSSGWGYVEANSGDGALILKSGSDVKTLTLTGSSNLVVEQNTWVSVATRGGAASKLYCANNADVYYSSNVTKLPIDIYYINAAQENDEIALSQDITLADGETLNVPANHVTLDLNGHTITKTDGADAPIVIDGVTATIIKNSGTTGGIVATGCDAAVSAQNGGEVGLNGIALTGGTHSVWATTEGKISLYSVSISGTTSQPIYADHGKVYVTSGTYENIGDCEVVYVTNNSVLDVSNATITSTSTSRQAPAIRICNGSSGTITAGAKIETTSYCLWIFEDNKDYEGTSCVISQNATLTSSACHCVNVVPLSFSKADYAKDRNADRKPVSLTVRDEVTIETTAPTTPSASEFVDGYYAVCGNGTAHNTEINIEGGTLKSTCVGLYHPQIGTLNISGGTITGEYGAVEIRAGVLNLTGGTLTQTGSCSLITAANTNGHTTNGAALAIAQHTYSDTDAAGTALGNPTVEVNISQESNIVETVLSGVYSFYESNPNKNATVSGAIRISSGSFDGPVYSEDFTGFIYGGTFRNYGGDDFTKYIDAEIKTTSMSVDDKVYYVGLVG